MRRCWLNQCTLSAPEGDKAEAEIASIREAATEVGTLATEGREFAEVEVCLGGRGRSLSVAYSGGALPCRCATFHTPASRR